MFRRRKTSAEGAEIKAAEDIDPWRESSYRSDFHSRANFLVSG
jgi:hypothetical protein